MVHIETQEVKVLRSNQKNAKMGPGCRHSFRVVRGCGWRVWGLQPFTTYSRPSFGAEGDNAWRYLGKRVYFCVVGAFLLRVRGAICFCWGCAACFFLLRVSFAVGAPGGGQRVTKTPKNPEP